MTTTTADTTTVPAATSGEPALLAHSYDGIREYDNPLPGWWRAIFWGSIVFAAGYYVWFHVASYGETPDHKYQAALADYQSKKLERDASGAANVTEDMLAKAATDPNLVERGAQVFATRCASCHTADGRGLIGPNLTDLYQLHGDTRMDIFKTIRGGVPGTAMPAWGEQLQPGEVVAAAAFVATLRGKNVPGGKEAQGQPVKMFEH